MSDAQIDQLRADIQTLARVLLPSLPATAVPSSDQKLQTRSFLVLAHSAIEELLEESIHRAVKGCFSIRGVAAPLIALSLAAKYSEHVIGQHGGKVPDPGKIADMLPGLFYTKAIKANNGIRKTSIEGMCKPLGIDIAKLGDVCDSALAALDTLGVKRGASAHTLRDAAQETIHPVQAREWVDGAVDAVATLLPLVLQEIENRTLGNIPSEPSGPLGG